MPRIAPPTLRDGELTLRPPQPADADAVTVGCQEVEVQRWIDVPSPYRREHAEEWIAGAPHRARGGLAVNLLAFEGDRLAGSFSLMEIDRSHGYSEIGYWVAADARRRGVATRCVTLLEGWARAELGLETIEILVHPENVPSRRVAERSGFAETGERRDPPPRLGVGAKLTVYVRKA